jgi:hypothetical protein
MIDPPYGVIWSGTQFVAVGDGLEIKGPVVVDLGGTVVSSPDGTHWTLAAVLGTLTTGAGPLNGIAWSGTEYVVVGWESTLATSPDGVTWTLQTSPEANAVYNSVAWSGSAFVAVGSEGSTAVIDTSPDGITWTAVNSSGIAELEGIAWSGKEFVAVGSGGIYASQNGTAWTHQAAPIGTGVVLHGVTYGRSEFLAVGDSGTILTSLDGVTWTKQTGP